MDEITKKMKIHYSETFEKYGANVRGVDWGGRRGRRYMEA